VKSEGFDMGVGNYHLEVKGFYMSEKNYRLGIKNYMSYGGLSHGNEFDYH
jgi:hypothetical protein